MGKVKHKRASRIEAKFFEEELESFLPLPRDANRELHRRWAYRDELYSQALRKVLIEQQRWEQKIVRNRQKARKAKLANRTRNQSSRQSSGRSRRTR